MGNHINNHKTPSENDSQNFIFSCCNKVFINIIKQNNIKENERIFPIINLEKEKKKRYF